MNCTRVLAQRLTAWLFSCQGAMKVELEQVDLLNKNWMHFMQLQKSSHMLQDLGYKSLVAQLARDR